ncbi:MAG: cobalamin B12-binding domain-containing protein [Sulfuricellaceae bacterium]
MCEVIDDTLYQRYLAALLAGDRMQCAGVAQDLAAKGTAIKDLYIHLFQRSLCRIGELWEQQQISVAVEHLATAITGRMLSLLQAQVFSGATRGRTIVIACIADEHHQIGSRMVADYCELLGLRAYFLGANMPLPDLLQLINQCRPTLLGLSVTLTANLPALLEALDALGSAFPDLPILVGGQAFRRGGLAAIYALRGGNCPDGIVPSGMQCKTQIAPCGNEHTSNFNAKVAPAGGNPTGQFPPRKAYDYRNVSYIASLDALEQWLLAHEH